MADNLNFFNDLLPIDTDKEKQLEEQNQFANLIDDEPGKTTDSAIADPLAESNVMGSGLESGSLELPKVTEKEIQLDEREGIEALKKKIGGLGFTFEESSMIDAFGDYLPGSDYVNITSPPDADGNTVTEKFSFDKFRNRFNFMGMGSAQAEADEINAFVKKHARDSQDINASTYTSAWNYVNKRAKEQDLSKLSSQELIDFGNNITADLDKSKDITSVKKRVEDGMVNFIDKSVVELKRKHNINTTEGRNAALEELNSSINKEYNNRIINDPEYKKIRQSNLKAVEGYFSQDLPKQIRKEGELEVMPDWVNNNPLGYS